MQSRLTLPFLGRFLDRRDLFAPTIGSRAHWFNCRGERGRGSFHLRRFRTPDFKRLLRDVIDLPAEALAGGGQLAEISELGSIAVKESLLKPMIAHGIVPAQVATLQYLPRTFDGARVTVSIPRVEHGRKVFWGVEIRDRDAVDYVGKGGRLTWVARLYQKLHSSLSG